jgi:hypothetical protein
LNLRLGNWKKFLVKASIVSAIIILVDLVIVYLYGSTIWLYAGYLFGNNVKTTLSTLLFIEGAAILVLGFVWLSGAMEVNFDGSNIRTNIYNRKEQWKQRPNELEQENSAGKVMILVGLPVFIVSLILILI